jgi:YHS domain-containing protein
MQLTYWHQSRRTLSIVAHVVLLLTSVAAGAAEKGSAFFSESGVAIRGYDPVAYFIAQKAAPGKATLTYEWRGTTWQFSSQRNRAKFIANPQLYAPQYGGYCAYAASNNYIAPTDPHAWRVYDGTRRQQLAGSAVRALNKNGIRES